MKTDEDIVRMAREAGAVFPADGSYHTFVFEGSLERFAALVASAEREAINKEAKAHLEELQKNFNAESAELRLHMWSQEKQA